VITKLIAKTREVLVATLGGVIPNAAAHIVAAPVTPPTPEQLPLLVLAAGDLTIIRQAPESQNSQPRPQGYRQRLAVSEVTPAGPYALDHQPLQGTAQAVAIFAAGQVAERRVRLQEGKDFTINYAAQSISMIFEVSQADTIALTYSFVGVFTVRDFEQGLLLDIFAAEVLQMEQLASLASGVLLVFHDELVEAFNQDPAFQTIYTAGAVTTTHLLSRLQFQSGHLIYTPALKMSLTFMASGQITAARAITEGFGLIAKIHSPGITSEHPVDIEIELE
jgi:hypothetical protein